MRIDGYPGDLKMGKTLLVLPLVFLFLLPPHHKLLRGPGWRIFRHLQTHRPSECACEYEPFEIARFQNRYGDSPGICV